MNKYNRIGGFTFAKTKNMRTHYQSNVWTHQLCVCILSKGLWCTVWLLVSHIPFSANQQSTAGNICTDCEQTCRKHYLSSSGTECKPISKCNGLFSDIGKQYSTVLIHWKLVGTFNSRKLLTFSFSFIKEILLFTVDL